MKKKFKLSFYKSEALYGYLFCLPFILGFLLLFLYPFVQATIYSINELMIKPNGFELKYIGLDNYKNALFINPEFPRLLIDSLISMFSTVPLILIFSFFAAILLNQKFKGRLLARLIFFLPIVMGAGIVLRMEQMDYMSAMLGVTASAAGASSDLLLGNSKIAGLLMNLKLPEQFMIYIINGVVQVSSIIKASGIQILIFLAGLQSIPSSLYEAADVEGATAWEGFWKITLPLLSPLILTNVVYTIVDFFTSVNNPLVEYIQDYAFTGAGSYGISIAMSWIYFLLVAILLVITIGIISRMVFYME